MLIELTPGVDFTNILQKQLSSQSFCSFGIFPRKSFAKNVDEIDP
jgi:hypothetical protein